MQHVSLTLLPQGVHVALQHRRQRLPLHATQHVPPPRAVHNRDLHAAAWEGQRGGQEFDAAVTLGYMRWAARSGDSHSWQAEPGDSTGSGQRTGGGAAVREVAAVRGAAALPWPRWHHRPETHSLSNTEGAVLLKGRSQLGAPARAASWRRAMAWQFSGCSRGSSGTAAGVAAGRQTWGRRAGARQRRRQEGHALPTELQ